MLSFFLFCIQKTKNEPIETSDTTCTIVGFCNILFLLYKISSTKMYTRQKTQTCYKSLVEPFCVQKIFCTKIFKFLFCTVTIEFKTLMTSDNFLAFMRYFCISIQYFDTKNLFRCKIFISMQNIYFDAKYLLDKKDLQEIQRFFQLRS